jgi:enamine deaminase RidA (YjgF/YER057c/UK114 family)
MRGNIRFSNPDTMQKPPGYSHVVEVTGPGRTVYFAGQLGIDKSGRMGTNAHEQMKIAFENVKAALASVGAGFEHVVKLNNYIVDIGVNLAHYREVRDKYVNTVFAAGQHHGRCASAGAPRRVVRGRSHRDIAAEIAAVPASPPSQGVMMARKLSKRN